MSLAQWFSNVAQRTLYDIRDSNSYVVRKLADGNCWMTENLKLVLSAGTPVVAASNTSAMSYSFTPTSCSMNGECAMNGNTKVYGGKYYYSWYALTAGTVNSSAAVGTDAPASLCPIGWRLPANYYANADYSYSTIYNAYFGSPTATTSSSISVFPFDITNTGLLRDGSILESNAVYLPTSTVKTVGGPATYIDILYRPQSSATSYPVGQSTYKNYGELARCVAL